MATEVFDTYDYLRYLQFDYLPKGIPVVKRINMNIIRKSFAQGGVLNITIIMEEVQVADTVPAAQGGQANHTLQAYNVNNNCGAPKVYINPITKFSGDTVDYA